jgi:hypothetical protein
MPLADRVLANTAQPATGLPDLGFFGRVFSGRVGKWIALSQYGFPFSFRPYSSPVARCRALARQSRFARQGRVARAAAAIAMTLAWPFGAFYATVRARGRMRERKQAPHGTKVFLDVYWLALRHSIPPYEYALYRFNEVPVRKGIREYLYWNDLPALAALNSQTGADNRDVQDKKRFAQICAGKGFPHVGTLAAFDGGRQTHPITPFVPDAPKLWTKSLRLKGGAGGAKWIRHGNSYSDRDGRAIHAGNLAEEFRRHDCLVQSFLENHPEIACVSNGALAALRIVTGMNAKREAEFVATLMCLPHGVSESSVGAIVCSINPGDGHIRHAALPGGEPVTHHPDTGVRITGIVLPYWHESVDLVSRAHAAAFPRFAFLGWDIALTEDGPVLLEANSGWGAIFHQMLDGPLGRTAFSRLVSQYL